MSKITSPSGRIYQWDKPTPPTKDDVDALVAYDSQIGSQPQTQGPATIAEMRRREEQGLVGALPPDMSEAVKRSAEVGGLERFVGEMGRLPEPTGQIAPPEYLGGRIAPSGKLTPLAQAESRGMRRGFATGLPISASLISAPFIAGMGIATGLATEAGVNLAASALGQTVSPEPYRAGEMFAQAIPGVPVAQQARKFTQFTKEAGSGVLTSGLQAGIETLDQDSADLSDVLFRTGLEGF